MTPCSWQVKYILENLCLTMIIENWYNPHLKYRYTALLLLLLYTSPCAQFTVRPNKWKCQRSEQTKVYCRNIEGEQVAYAHKIPKLPEKFQQSIFKGQVRERNPRVWNLSTAEIIYFLCCTSRHANEEHQTTGSLSFFSLGLQGKSPCSTHVDLSPFSQWFLQHMVFLLKSSVLSRRDQCQSSSPMAHEEEVRSNSTTCLYQLWSWISLLRDCSGGLST